MATGLLTIDLGALARNWRDLDAKTGVETGAVVKADGYGLGASIVSRRLAREGVRKFFVAVAEEGRVVRSALGDGPEIYVFSGHMPGDTQLIRDFNLIPLNNCVDQMLRHFEALPRRPFGVQLDSGMNRLGMEPAEWAALRGIVLPQRPRLVMSHLACADEPGHPMNERQLRTFREITDGVTAPRSLAATGGVLMRADFHFDLCRPGVGLYGGLPFIDASPVITLDLPVIQCRDVEAGEPVGYGNKWTAPDRRRIATIAAGYGDGLIRALAPKASLHAGHTSVEVVGRVSMDLITVDVTPLGQDPDSLQLIGRHQSIDTIAAMSDTIGYEILTSLGNRYLRRIVE
jgi:alanine racemase